MSRTAEIHPVSNLTVFTSGFSRVARVIVHEIEKETRSGTRTQGEIAKAAGLSGANVISNFKQEARGQKLPSLGPESLYRLSLAVGLDNFSAPFGIMLMKDRVPGFGQGVMDWLQGEAPELHHLVAVIEQHADAMGDGLFGDTPETDHALSQMIEAARSGVERFEREED